MSFYLNLLHSSSNFTAKQKYGTDIRHFQIQNVFAKNTSNNSHHLFGHASIPFIISRAKDVKNSLEFPRKTNFQYESDNSIKDISTPTMTEILAASKAQNLDLQLQTLGPFFRITARSLETQNELGRAEGLIRVWLRGRILHLDSIRLRRETLGMEKSIFGIGLFIGAVAIRYGYECGCRTAELLAINDSDLYHSKLVRFYTRIGFKAVHEVTGSTIGDLAHMLVWGGMGTRMDANVEELLIKWCTRFKN